MAVDSSYMLAPGESQSSIDQRRKLAMLLHQQAVAPQEVKHWTQGLANMLNAGITGYELHSLDKADREEIAKANEMIAGLYGGSSGTAAPASPAALPSGGAPRASTAEKIYTNDEPSPLDPPSGDDRTRMMATILGESANQGPQGMNAVASVIRNRAVDGGYGGNTPSGVVTAPNQFEPWNTPEGRQKMAAMLANPQLAAKADAAIASAYGEGGNAPNDPTMGATHFFAPKAQAALGRPVPAWGAGPGQMIGDHKFIGGKPGAPVQVAGEVPTGDPAALPPNAQPVQGYAVPGASQSGQPSREMIMKLLGNRHTRGLGQQMLAQQLKPQTTDDIREFEYGQRNPAFAQRQIDLKQASRPQVNIDQRGENAFAKTANEGAAKSFREIVDSGRDAQSMVADLNALREIGGRISTGKVAEVRAVLGPYAEALGIKMEGLDDMQAYNAIVAKLAPRMRVPGSGATSDFEMQNFLKSLPGLGKTPGGNEIIANSLEAIQQHKIAASEIASRALAGEITPREAEKELRALPDPLTLWKKQGKALVPQAPKIDVLRKKYGLQ